MSPVCSAPSRRTGKKTERGEGRSRWFGVRECSRRRGDYTARRRREDRPTSSPSRILRENIREGAHVDRDVAPLPGTVWTIDPERYKTERSRWFGVRECSRRRGDYTARRRREDRPTSSPSRILRENIREAAHVDRDVAPLPGTVWTI
jgi:hypothetical protein